MVKKGEIMKKLVGIVLAFSIAAGAATPSFGMDALNKLFGQWAPLASVVGDMGKTLGDPDRGIPALTKNIPEFAKGAKTTYELFTIGACR